MAKKKLGKWMHKMQIGSASVTVHGKTKRAAKANALRFLKAHVRNPGRFVYVLRGDREGAIGGQYPTWISAKLAARREAKRLRDKVRVHKQRPN